jgi:uncharacterized protein (TIGR03086 family)
MSGPGDVWQQAADNFDRHYRAIADDQWDAPTPCGDWTVRELVDHVVHWQALTGAEVGAGTSPGDSWDDVKSAIETALEDPSNLEGVTEAEGFAGLPKHQALGIATGDVLVHSWDLARAIGADETLPIEAVEAVQMGLSRFPPEMLRSPNMFGPEVEVADDASAQDKLLGFTGRQP